MQPGLQELLHALFIGAIELALAGLVVLLAFLNRDGLWRHARHGLLLGLIGLALALPVNLFSHVYANPFLLETPDDTSLRDSALMQLLSRFSLALGLMALLIRVCWQALGFCAAAAEWDRLRAAGWLQPRRPGDDRRRWILGSAVFGVAVGAFSTLLFQMLGVGLGSTISRVLALHPQLAQAPTALLLGIGLAFVIGAALAEEIVFRGVLQGFLLRLTRESGIGIVLTTLLVSGVWAAEHLLNTDSPALKLAQIFLIGLVLSELARRGGILSSISAHVGLNLSATLLPYGVRLVTGD